MTLKQLEAFFLAATCPSFSVAAQRVHVTVSSLSKRIAELEQSLGVELFDRKSNKATLTDAGHRLVPLAQKLLHEAEEVRHLVTSGAELVGVCKFGVGELSALTWLPKFVSRARLAHPKLQMKPTVEAGSSSGSLEQRVVDGSLDFAVIAGRSKRTSIRSELVGKVAFRWVASQTLVGRTRIFTPDRLTAMPMVTLPDGTGTTRILDEWLDACNCSIEHRLTCNSWGAVAGLLTEGLGVGFLPSGWAELLIDKGEVVELKTSRTLGTLRYMFQFRRDDRRALVSQMLSEVQAAIDFNAIGGQWLPGPESRQR